MDQMDFDAVIGSMIDKAVDFTNNIEDDRVRATNAYRGEKYGDEVEGRSQVVTREIRDTVRQVMPSLMRILAGAEQPCVYQATRPGDDKYAQQATDYVRYIFESDNNGYIEAWNAVEDALVRKTGIFKVWHQDVDKTSRVSWTGVNEDEIELIEADDDVTIEEIEESDTAADGTPLFDVSGVRIESESRIRLQAVPPEEFILIDQGDALRGHRRRVTYSELREMGYEASKLDDSDIDWSSDSVDQEESRQARDKYADSIADEDSADDPSQRMTEYVEAYARVDFDGDGIAELRKVCTAGSARIILENEPVDDVPLIDFTAWPVAHSAIGESMADLTEDIQRISTSITRNTLNSLAQAVNPDIGVVEGMVNLDDVLSPKAGRIIRMKNPEAMREITYRFVGSDTLPMLDRLDRMKEKRTGITDASQGLDAKSMQSTTANAVDATQRAALGQVELLSRNIVETGFLPLYRLMLRMVIRHQDKPRMVQIAGSWETVDPKYWDSDMRVRPSQALGAGSEEQRVASLMQILAKQEQIIQVGGIDANPLITPKQYYNTLHDLTIISGFRDPERYFQNPDNFEPPEPKEPQPDPDMIRAQADAQKKQAEIQELQARLQLDQQKLQLDQQQANETDQRLRDTSLAKMMLEWVKFQEQQGEKADSRSMEFMFRYLESQESRASHEQLEIMKQKMQMQSQERNNNGKTE